MVADGIVSKRPELRPAHVSIPILYVIGYAFFSYIYYVSGGTDWQGNRYIYNFLDWDNDKKGLAGTIGLFSFIGVPIGWFAYAFLMRDSCQSAISSLVGA